MDEVYTFAMFFAVAFVFDRIEEYIEHMPEARRVVRVIKHGAMAVPTIHAFRDMAIHMLVYTH